MATRLYLRDLQANAIGSEYYDMIATAGAATILSRTRTEVDGLPNQLTHEVSANIILCWVSGRAPSGGFTLTTGTVVAPCKESSGSANARLAVKVYHRTSGGTETEIGGGPFNSGAEMNSASFVDQTVACNTTDQAFAEDERIVLRLFIEPTTSWTDGNSADVNYNDADATTGDAYYEIAETVTFKAESSASQRRRSMSDCNGNRVLRY